MWYFQFKKQCMANEGGMVMRYFYNRIRFTQGEFIHGGFYYLFKNILLNILFWAGLFSVVWWMKLYATEVSKTGINTIFLVNFFIYLFIVSKIYRQRLCVSVVTVSWVFTGIYSLFELFIAIICACINAGMVYKCCSSIPKMIWYFLATTFFVYFCLRISLISIILNWKKSNPLYILVHAIVITLFATCLVMILLSNLGNLVFDLVVFFVAFSLFKSICDGEWCPVIIFKA